MNASCPWSLFDDREKETLDTLIDVTGGLSTVLSFWFILAYFYTSLKDNWSYHNIGCFLISAWIRRAGSLTASQYVDRRNELWPDVPNCKVFAFLETFMAVHEVECLTHVCIERFVVAKYNTNGWAMPKKHYVMFRLLCVMFACAYAAAPALGVGGYGLDFTCSACTMDMVLPDGWKKYVVAVIFFLRSVKPVGVMIFMLIGCKAFESTYDDSLNNQLQRQITRDAIIITGICLLCWTPIAMIRGWVVLTQLTYGSGVFVLPSGVFVKWALLLHWNSLTPTVLALFLLDPSIRSATRQLRPGTIVGQIKTKTE